MKDKETSLVHLGYLLVKWRKLIFINLFIFTSLVAVFSLIMPKTFTATAVILPPVSSDQTSLLSQLTGIPIQGLGLEGNLNQDIYNFLAILSSRTVMQTVIENFNLKQRFNVKTNEEALEILNGKVISDWRDDGMISIIVNVSTGYLSSDSEEDSTRLLAANMTNFFVNELDRVNKNLQTKQAQYQRIFIGERLDQNKSDLAKAENKMKEFQEKHNVIDLPEQIRAAILTAAEIKAKIITSEVELGALEALLEPNHPKVLSLKTEINELRRAMKEIKYGETSYDSVSTLALFPFFVDAPELGLKFIQLTRELEIQNKLYEFLIQQYEQAKIQEAKDTPTVQVLDKAIPPEFRSRPVRTLMVVISAMASLLFSFIFIGFLEYIKKIEEHENGLSGEFQFIIHALQNDLKRLKFWKQ
jgi:uncharacterized protein involved in exopolysaccharide biosynthesis